MRYTPLFTARCLPRRYFLRHAYAHAAAAMLRYARYAIAALLLKHITLRFHFSLMLRRHFADADALRAAATP